MVLLNVTIGIELPEQSDINLNLFDILGNQRINYSNSGISNLNHLLNLETIESGVYLLEIKIGNEIYHKKIIKK